MPRPILTVPNLQQVPKGSEASAAIGTKRVFQRGAPVGAQVKNVVAPPTNEELAAELAEVKTLLAKFYSFDDTTVNLVLKTVSQGTALVALQFVNEGILKFGCAEFIQRVRAAIAALQESKPSFNSLNTNLNYYALPPITAPLHDCYYVVRQTPYLAALLEDKLAAATSSPWTAVVASETEAMRPPLLQWLNRIHYSRRVPEVTSAFDRAIQQMEILPSGGLSDNQMATLYSPPLLDEDAYKNVVRLKTVFDAYLNSEQPT